MSSFSCLINENITIVCLFYVSVFILTRYWPVRNPAKNGDVRHLVLDFEKQNKSILSSSQTCFDSCKYATPATDIKSVSTFPEQTFATTLKLSNFMIAKPFISAFCNSRANFSSASHILLLETRVGESVESALSALAAIFWLLACILTIFNKKYCILTCRDKRESYLIVLQNNVKVC